MSWKDPTGASAPGKTFSGVGERSHLTFDTHNQPPVLPLLFSSDKQANFFPVSVQIQSLGYHPWDQVLEGSTHPEEEPGTWESDNKSQAAP